MTEAEFDATANQSVAVTVVGGWPPHAPPGPASAPLSQDPAPADQPGTEKVSEPAWLSEAVAAARRVGFSGHPDDWGDCACPPAAGPDCPEMTTDIKLALLAAAPIIEAAALDKAAEDVEAQNCYGESGVVAYLRERARALTEGATDA